MSNNNIISYQFLKMIKAWTCLSKTVVISDPIYGEKNRIKEIENLMRGRWKAIVTDKGGKASSLVTWHDSILRPKDDAGKDVEWLLLDFSVAVDSDKMGIFDKVIYPIEQDTGEEYEPKSFYGKCCNIVSNAFWGILDEGGIITSAPEGNFDVYILREEDEVIAIKISFITEGEPLADVFAKLLQK